MIQVPIGPSHLSHIEIGYDKYMDEYMTEVEAHLADPGAICAYHMGDFFDLISESYALGRSAAATAREIESQFM